VMINNNEISIIRKHAFAKSRHIKFLNLERNPVKTIQSMAFSELFNVDYLYLPDEIETIEPDAFKGLLNLHVMQLPHLDTPALLPHTFRGLEQLKSLTIMDAKIGVIKANAFAGIETVEFVQILRSDIRRIRRKSFAGIRNVKHLELRGNTIRRWDASTFGIGDVQEMSAGETGVESIEINDNLLNCSCDNTWWIRRDGFGLSSVVLAGNRCFAPTSLQTVRLDEIDVGHFLNCTENAGDYVDEEYSAQLTAYSAGGARCFLQALFVVLPLILASYL